MGRLPQLLLLYPGRGKNAVDPWKSFFHQPSPHLCLAQMACLDFPLSDRRTLLSKSTRKKHSSTCLWVFQAIVSNSWLILLGNLYSRNTFISSTPCNAYLHFTLTPCPILVTNMSEKPLWPPSPLSPSLSPSPLSPPLLLSPSPPPHFIN